MESMPIALLIASTIAVKRSCKVSPKIYRSGVWVHVWCIMLGQKSQMATSSAGQACRYPRVVRKMSMLTCVLISSIHIWPINNWILLCPVNFSVTSGPKVTTLEQEERDRCKSPKWKLWICVTKSQKQNSITIPTLAYLIHSWVNKSRSYAKGRLSKGICARR